MLIKLVDKYVLCLRPAMSVLACPICHVRLAMSALPCSTFHAQVAMSDLPWLPCVSGWISGKACHVWLTVSGWPCPSCDLRLTVSVLTCPNYQVRFEMPTSSCPTYRVHFAMSKLSNLSWNAHFIMSNLLFPFCHVRLSSLFWNAHFIMSDLPCPFCRVRIVKSVLKCPLDHVRFAVSVLPCPYCQVRFAHFTMSNLPCPFCQCGLSSPFWNAHFIMSNLPCLPAVSVILTIHLTVFSALLSLHRYCFGYWKCPTYRFPLTCKWVITCCNNTLSLISIVTWHFLVLFFSSSSFFATVSAQTPTRCRSGARVCV